MKTQKYFRKPFEIEAVQVTEENMPMVGDWCRGVIKRLNGLHYIHVKTSRPMNARQTRAYPGDWVLRTAHGFKVYQDKPFHATFEKVE